MKGSLGDRERLLHILEAIENIESFLQSMGFDEFIGSKLHRAATERQLEIIGEATAAISDKLKEKYSEIEWQPINFFSTIYKKNDFTPASTNLPKGIWINSTRT